MIRARSGATATEIRPPFERKWYRLFPDEGLMAGVQPVIAEGKVFVGTMRGTLHAMDSDTGQDVWVYRAEGRSCTPAPSATARSYSATAAAGSAR